MVDRTANALRLTALDERAASAGLSVGMALTDARALFQDLEVRRASLGEDAQLLERLADWCDRYTPLVALDAPYGILLDITGCTHLFGGEAALLKDILQRMEGHGFAIRGAVASHAAAAHSLARFTAGGIFDDQEIEGRLSNLPLDALDLDDAGFAGLKRAGLRTLGDVRAIPRSAITARFGARLIRQMDTLFGQEQKPISPRRIVPLCIVERRMAEPMVAMDAIEMLVQSLGRELFAHLQQRGEGARQVEASFFRVDGQVRRVGVEAGRALTDATMLYRLFRERLSSLVEPLDAGYGFDVVRLSAVTVERVVATQKSLDNRQEESADVEGLLDRLATRLGASRVVRPVAVNTHIPERAVVMVSAARHHGNTAVAWSVEQLPAEPPTRPIRLFEPPERIDIIAAEVPDGPPAQFRWRRVMHRVLLAEGPERIAPEWWSEHRGTPFRDYYRVEDDAGRRFWVFREDVEGQPSRWFLHGLFA